MHRYLGLAHAHAHQLRLGLARHLRAESGQGTVEYVGLILLIAGVLAAVVSASGSFNGKAIGQTIVNELKQAIDGVGKKG